MLGWRLPGLAMYGDAILYRLVALVLPLMPFSAAAQNVISTAAAARPADFPGIEATFDQALVGVPAG